MVKPKANADKANTEQANGRVAVVVGPVAA